MGLLRSKVFIPLVKGVYLKSLRYLSKYNSYERYVIPDGEAKPLLAIHTACGLDEGGASHLLQWIDSFRKTNIEFIIICRKFDTYEFLNKVIKENAISLCYNSRHSDKIINNYKSLKAIFYLSNTGSNNQFLRYPGLRHIFLGHGDSDKTASVNRLFKVYDEVFVAGQAHVDRFLNADFDCSSIKFKIVGRPIFSEKILNDNESRKIVYLPTWEGFHSDQNYSSLLIGCAILNSVNKFLKNEIYVKTHPSTGFFNKNFLKIEEQLLILSTKNNFKFLDKKKSINKALKHNSIFICDVSASVTECLAFDCSCPILVFLPERGEKLMSSKINYDYYAYTYKSVEQLESIIKDLLNGIDPLFSRRKEARDYLVGPRDHNRLFNLAVNDLI